MHLGVAQRVLRVYHGVLGDVPGAFCLVCQTWLRLSRKVDECKPLAHGRARQLRLLQPRARDGRARRQGLTLV